jgi:hypothetical protein
MRRDMWIGVFMTTLIAAGGGLGGEPPCSEPAPSCFLQAWRPAGGFSPYGGGLLHWWDPNCFPCWCAPDDYCRKPLPKVCWPDYPSYYIWGPPQTCCPEKNGARDCSNVPLSTGNRK